MIQSGSVAGCGSPPWPSRHGIVTPPIPQSAFADSSLCTREPSLLPSIQPAKFRFPARQRSLGAASRCSPPCAKGGQHGNAMQGGIDSTQLPGRYQVPGVGMVSQVPSIPQSAFADSSLCTREVRWPDGPSAWAVISLLAVLHPTGPFCGTLPGLPPAPTGAGSPAPEHRSITTHTAFSEFWPSRHGTRVVF